jgi:hypothetical protein
VSTTDNPKKLPARGTVRLEGTVYVQRGRPTLLTAVPAEEVVRHKKVNT